MSAPFVIIRLWHDGSMLLESAATRSVAESQASDFKNDPSIKSVWITESERIAGFERDVRLYRKSYAKYHALNNTARMAALQVWSKSIDYCKRTAVKLGRNEKKAIAANWRKHAKALGLKPVITNAKPGKAKTK